MLSSEKKAFNVIVFLLPSKKTGKDRLLVAQKKLPFSERPRQADCPLVRFPGAPNGCGLKYLFLDSVIKSKE
jgi:hypothetical protein